MKKHYSIAMGSLLILIGVLFSPGRLFAQQVVAVPIQMPECTANVPGYQIDLSANPNLSFTTPEVLRQPTCCNDGDRYLAFYVTLHPDVAMIEVVVAPGYADPGGSGNYQLVTGGDLITPGMCGPEQDAGSPFCITGSGPHKILYSKPGGNLVKYIFRQIPKPIYPLSQLTRVGCSLPLAIDGLNNINVTATSASGNCLATTAQLNSFLSCTNCATPTFTAGAISGQTYPYSVTYTVTGTPKAAACGSFPTSGTFTITVYDELKVNITTDANYYCENSAGTWLVAHPTGGRTPYTYVWKNGTTPVPSPLGDSLLVNTPGGYTCTVSDQLITSTCGSVTSNILTIIEGNEPVVTPALTSIDVCANNPIVNLSGTVQYATGGNWTGGNGGTFDPLSTSFGSYANTPKPVNATYTASSTDIGNGSITLYLNSTGATGGCTDVSVPVTINFIDSIFANPVASPISCYGGTSTLTAAGTGGVGGPYSYTWSTNPITTGPTTTAPAGTYLVVVQDGFGCHSTTSISVSEPSQINLALSSTIDNFGAPCDGTASVIATGGTGGYSYDWSGTPTGDGTNSISGLCYGLDTVLVTDANGCSVEGYVVVSNFTCQSFDVGINAHTDVSCFGGSDGNATASIVSGGNSPFDFQWTNSNGTVVSSTNDILGPNTASSLPAGSYTVLVTDALGCMDVAGVSITEPTPLFNTMSHTDVSFIGGNNGSATANPSGGTPAYSYAWTTVSGTIGSPANGQTITGLTSGIGGVMYYVDIMDSKSCAYEDSVLINQPPCNDFQIAVNTVDALCNGDSNGEAYLVITNGVGPYNIVWSDGTPGAGNMSVTDLAAGGYTVTVTDQNKNCTTFTSFAITEPSPLTLGLVPTNVTCYGDQNGTIDLTVSGGTYPFVYTWKLSNGKIFSNFEDITQLGPDTYTVTVVDANGCTATSSIGITQPAKLLGTNTRVDNPCFGNSIGSITATATSGTGVFPYLYSWTGPNGFTAFGSTISSLPAGLYTYTITDLNGCTYVENVNINQPLLLTASATMTAQVTCAGGNDGAADLTVDGGTTPYTYVWSNGSTLQDPTNFSAGTFNVTVTDAKSCTANTSVIITTVPDVTSPVITCPGNQSANTTTTSCTYTHTGNTWNATATDNCVTPALTWVLTGATTGSGSTTLNGVTFNKGVTIVEWFATDGLGNKDSCEYTVTITDVTYPTILSCGGSTQSVNVDAGQCNFTQTGTAWNATAFDNCPGLTLTATLTGATTASGLTTLTGVDFNLGTTIVTWTAMDAVGLTATCTFSITVVDNINPNIISCGGTGTQTVLANTGVCTYTHTGSAWDATATDNCTIVTLTYTLSGATSGTGSTLNNVVFNQGTTLVTWKATDGSGNFVTCTFNVQVGDNQDPAITNCSAIGNQVVPANIGVCTYTHNNNTWNATATDNCTVSSLVYTLTGATSGTGTSLNGRLFNLGVTTVTWVATDVAGNTDTCQFTVTVEDTQIPVMLSCGAVGNQTVVTDLGECNFTQTGTGWNATADDNCSIASIDYVLTGATTGTGSTLNNVSFNLGLTTVTWTATDGSGNTASCSFTVLVRDTQLPVISSCGATGNQNVTTDNGVCTFTQTGTGWNATATDNCTITSLTYTLTGATTGTGITLAGVAFNQGLTTVTWTAIDTANNQVQCQFTVTVSDDEFPAIANCPNPIVQNNDNGDCGAIVNWTVPTFTDNCGAVMSASHSPNTFFPVGNTNVTYTVVDNAGNTSTCSFAINVVDAELPVIICPDTIASCNPNVAFELPTATDNCDVDTIIQLAGLPSGSVFPVGLTVNVFEVTDVHGNSSTCSFTVRIYPLPVASNTVEDVSCFGFGDGSVDLTLTNGAAPYQTNWSNGQTTEDISGLTPGTYTVGVIDNNGCTTTDTAVITQPTALTLEGLVDNVSCYNLQNGSIQITVDGGTLPYTYNWQSGQTSEDLNGLDTGSYVLNVTDANGCEIDFSTTITQPDTLTIQAVVYGATCNAANGSIQTLVTGGTTPYVYNWSNGGSNQNLNNVPAGIYTLDVLDAQGCQVSYTGEVLPEINLTASILAKDVSCYGGSNGELTAIVSNGNEPYTYSWSNGETTAHVEGLTAGNYDLLITDVFGCTANLTAVINQPDTLTIDISLSSYLEGYNVSSNGGTDGYISTSVAGGVAPYTYYWSNGDTTAFVDQLSAGEYLVVVTDHNNCVSAISVVLTQPDVLEMPQGFSPNADGENDFFVVHGIKSYPENTITVFNRWGNIVYQKDGYADEWYGENNSGEALPDATYFVILKAMVAGKEVVLQGYVDLRRK